MPGMKERKGLLSPALQQAGPAQIPRITVHLIQQKRGRQTSVPSADFHAMKSRGIKGKIGANVRDSGIRVKRIKTSRIIHGRMGTERTKEKEKNKTKHCDYLGRYVNVGSLHLKLIECYMLSRLPFKKKTGGSTKIIEENNSFVPTMCGTYLKLSIHLYKPVTG